MNEPETEMPVFIHPTAAVSPEAKVGAGTRVWHHVQVRERARIGRNCILSKGTYVDVGVAIGCCCKLQNGSSVYHGATLEDGVFVGPGTVLTNDKLPRAINPDGTLKRDADWEVGEIRVRRGASLGALAVVLPGVTIGVFAMVGAGAVVTCDVPDYGLVLGSPARLVGFVCPCGGRLAAGEMVEGIVQARCGRCGQVTAIPAGTWESAGVAAVPEHLDKGPRNQVLDPETPGS